MGQHETQIATKILNRQDPTKNSSDIWTPKKQLHFWEGGNLWKNHPRFFLNTYSYFILKIMLGICTWISRSLMLSLKVIPTFAPAPVAVPYAPRVILMMPWQISMVAEVMHFGPGWTPGQWTPKEVDMSLELCVTLWVMLFLFWWDHQAGLTRDSSIQAIKKGPLVV